MKSHSMVAFLALTVLFSSFTLQADAPISDQQDTKNCIPPGVKPAPKVNLKNLIPKLPRSQSQTKAKDLKKMEQLLKDELVCEKNGTLLGLLNYGQSCRTINTKCQVMVKKGKNLPPKVIQRITQEKIRKIQTPTKAKIVTQNKRKRRRWTLKGRTAEIKQKLREEKAKKKPDKKAQAKALLSNIKAAMKENPDNLNASSLRRIMKKGKALKKVAEVKLKLPKIDKDTGIVTLPKLKVKKKEEKQEIGNYCVHAVHYNLNYCCYFKKKSDASFFANTQPDVPIFKKKMNMNRIMRKRMRMKRMRRRRRIVKFMLKRSLKKKGPGVVFRAMSQMLPPSPTLKKKKS